MDLDIIILRNNGQIGHKFDDVFGAYSRGAALGIVAV